MPARRPHSPAMWSPGTGEGGAPVIRGAVEGDLRHLAPAAKDQESRLSSSIRAMLLYELSFLALHNRMVQLAMPTAVDAISPDSVVLMMGGRRLRATGD